MTGTGDTYVSYIIPLYPNEEQQRQFASYFGASRYAYNFALNEEISEYKKGNKFVGRNEMAKRFAKHRHSVGWLLNFIEHSLRYKLNDAISAFENWFKHNCGCPKFKSKKENNQSFHIREDRLTIYPDSIIFSKEVGKIQCGYIPDNRIIGFAYHGPGRDPSLYRNYYNPIIKKIGNKYYLSVSLKTSDGFDIFSIAKHDDIGIKDGTIGIDIGCKRDNWIVDSLGNKISLPDMTKENKKVSRLRKKEARQRASMMKTKSKKRSNNYIKTLNEINKYERRKINKRKSSLYDYISHGILDNKPETVVLETLYIRNWFPTKDNSRLSSKTRKRIFTNVLESAPRIVQDTIHYVCSRNGIDVVYADNHFPSTKRCSKCGHVQYVGNNRMYKCSECGSEIDRDLNAAINLSIYPSLV